MTTRRDGDWENTKQLLKNSNTVKRQPSSWLRHKGQAALIDYMIFEGKYTKEDIAKAIREMPETKARDIIPTIDQLILRVQRHIDHLNYDTSHLPMQAHECNVVIGINGIVKFKP